mmetsp:Transcript_13997/g.26681  ORF Transcript_13997/g.26681 Transcript_13997/m.26681 type:complete len:148 (+) Transcript_13997:267-710(+)|eukprot:CAMPEP_0201672974 /NCGR_PEP_ID=MMETSP0494-20130426/33591_1 /ASSEMBLY_ACC=CAM_ASM_000839 /TAXON_ID=420259 /ORGANISM="Thalassiosira gravida, Strain GMp14c1" /LENGTH=147 /DNA_ID=CAMNT_0048154777 /DNA_START=257 /DNA_END=700 /DNA_ORIENTATION=-
MGCFNVVSRHFTEEVLTKYAGEKVVKGFRRVSLTRNKAEGSLHTPLDNCDRDLEGRSSINANSPIVDAAEKLAAIKSGNAGRATDRPLVNNSKESDNNNTKSEPDITDDVADKQQKDRDLIEELRNENGVLKQKINRRGDRIKTLSA